MAVLRVCVYFWALCVSIFIHINNSHGSSICLPAKHAPLFVFGDSLYDNGINNYINTTVDFQCNFPPYGETFFKYPTGRFSDGRIIPDFIAEHAKLPLIPPYLNPAYRDQYIFGVNFASGGAGALVEVAQGMTVDLKTQVRYLKEVNKILRMQLGDAEAKFLLSKALYIFSIGANDYSERFVSKTSALLRYSRQEFVDIVIGNLTTAIKEIYNVGGRKFGFVNVGPVGCSPIVKIVVNGSKGACHEEVLAAARLHNKEFPKMLQKLEKQLKGFKYSLTDFYSAVEQVMKHPSKYGFKEVNSACCGGGRYRGDYSCGGKRGITKYELCKNPNEYLYFDSAHPTDRASQYYAQLMWNGSRTLTKPYNLKELFEL